MFRKHAFSVLVPGRCRALIRHTGALPETIGNGRIVFESGQGDWAAEELARQRRRAA